MDTTPTPEHSQPAAPEQPSQQDTPPAAPVAPSSPTPAPHVNTPGVIVLEWLSYAFWGWLILSHIWLLSVILINAISGQSVSSVIPYAIASGVVLLPIAFLTDFFYRKHEPLKKTGAAMVIMVIHAVLFALLGIIALITMVFNILNIVVETSTNIDTQLIIIFTALGATLLYAGAFVRTLNPFKSKTPTLAYSIAMISVTVLLFILAIVGPFMQTLATKDDRRIEAHLPAVAAAVNDYISENESLPADLGKISFRDADAAALVTDGTVTYKPETSELDASLKQTAHRYQLCVTYKEASNEAGYYYDTPYNYGYSSYVSTYQHDKGEVCYKIEEITQTRATIIDL